MSNNISVGKIIDNLIKDPSSIYPKNSIRDILYKLYLNCVHNSIQVISENASALGQTTDNFINSERLYLHNFVDTGIKDALKESGYKLKSNEIDTICRAFREDIIETLQKITSGGRKLEIITHTLVERAGIQCETLAKTLPKSLQNKLLKQVKIKIKSPKSPKGGRKTGSNIFEKLRNLFKPKKEFQTAAEETIFKAAEKPRDSGRLLNLVKETTPPPGIKITPKGQIPLTGILLSLGVDIALTAVMMSQPSDAATLSDRIYYEYKDILFPNYKYDNIAFGSAFDFYAKDIFKNDFRAKYSIIDYPYEYTQLARSYKKHNLSDKTWLYLSAVYLKLAKTNKKLKFSAEEFVYAYKWYNKLDDPEFKNAYPFELLLTMYNKLPYNFHDTRYTRELNIDLEAGEGDLILKKVLMQMRDYIMINEFNRVKLTQKPKD